MAFISMVWSCVGEAAPNVQYYGPPGHGALVLYLVTVADVRSVDMPLIPGPWPAQGSAPKTALLVVLTRRL
jgi:hypothetical protein